MSIGYLWRVAHFVKYKNNCVDNDIDTPLR